MHDVNPIALTHAQPSGGATPETEPCRTLSKRLLRARLADFPKETGGPASPDRRYGKYCESVASDALFATQQPKPREADPEQQGDRRLGDRNGIRKRNCSEPVDAGRADGDDITGRQVDRQQIGGTAVAIDCIGDIVFIERKGVVEVRTSKGNDKRIRTGNLIDGIDAAVPVFGINRVGGIGAEPELIGTETVRPDFGRCARRQIDRIQTVGRRFAPGIQCTG